MEVNEYAKQRKDLITAAYDYVGVPFLHAGRNRIGVDCIGLVIASAREAGLLTNYDNTDYSSVVNAKFFKSQIEMFCDEIPITDLEYGDLLLFSMRGTAHTTTHVGLYVAYGIFIHSDQAIGKVVVQALPGTWESRLISVYRWKQWRL